MAFSVVVIGTSWGGMRALEVLLSGLPSSFSIPIVIVQHRHKDSDLALASLLQQYSALPVIEVEDKTPMLPGRVYIAPANYHLLLESSHPSVDYPYFSLSTEAPVLHARPAIDVLFESAAQAYGQQVIGIILTGASADGAKGLAAIKDRGGFTLVQDPATAESPVMPEAAIAATGVDQILPLTDMPAALNHLCQPVRR